MVRKMVALIEILILNPFAFEETGFFFYKFYWSGQSLMCIQCILWLLLFNHRKFFLKWKLPLFA